MFMTAMTPVHNLVGTYTQCAGGVQFLLRRKNKVVTIQWEPFTGAISANGVAYIEAIQTIHNLPSYPVEYPIFLTYLGQIRLAVLEIVPSPPVPCKDYNYSCYKGGNIRFYLRSDKTGTGVNVNDTFSVPASTVSWIVE
jgi:hypothetical protein